MAKRPRLVGFHGGCGGGNTGHGESGVTVDDRIPRSVEPPHYPSQGTKNPRRCRESTQPKPQSDPSDTFIGPAEAYRCDESKCIERLGSSYASATATTEELSFLEMCDSVLETPSVVVVAVVEEEEEFSLTPIETTGTTTEEVWESSLQASFAERTATEMNELVQWWNSDQKKGQSCSLPKNSLILEDECDALHSGISTVVTLSLESLFDACVEELPLQTASPSVCNNTNSPDRPLPQSPAPKMSLLTPYEPLTPYYSPMKHEQVDHTTIAPESSPSLYLRSLSETMVDSSLILHSILQHPFVLGENATTTADRNNENNGLTMAQQQQMQVNRICSLTAQWAEECTRITGTERRLSTEGSTSIHRSEPLGGTIPGCGPPDLPRLPYMDQLRVAWHIQRVVLVDGVWLSLLSRLPLEYLTAWIWLTRHTRARTRHVLLTVVTIATLWLAGTVVVWCGRLSLARHVVLDPSILPPSCVTSCGCGIPFVEIAIASASPVPHTPFGNFPHAAAGQCWHSSAVAAYDSYLL